MRIPRGKKWAVLSRLASSPRNTPLTLGVGAGQGRMRRLCFRSRYLCCVLEFDASDRGSAVREGGGAGMIIDNDGDG